MTDTDKMDMLSPVSDEEREDGEIVDDDFEDISDYSIPSCGKSDYSESLISSISLSSISVSDSESGYYDKRQVYIASEGHADKKHVENVTRKKKHVENGMCSRKKLLEKKKLIEKALLDESLEEKKRQIQNLLVEKKKRIEKELLNDTVNEDVQRLRRAGSAATRTIRHRRRDPLITSSATRRTKRRKSISRSPCSDSSSNSDVLDRRTLRQLNKAVRIDSGDVQHKTLKDRLKRMIEPDVKLIEVNSVPTNSITIDVIEVIDGENSANALDTHKTIKMDESMDKELEELRLQALKSAMLEKHLKRKRRKEMIVNQNQNFELSNANNKENEEWNILLPPTPPVEKIEKPEGAVKVEQSEFDEKVVTLESELNVQKPAAQMKAEQLETKIVKLELIEESQSPKPAEKLGKLESEDDLDIMRAMLLASMSKKIAEDQPSVPRSLNVSPLPPELPNDKQKKSTSMPAIKLPPVKPLIIRVNYASESDSSDFEAEDEAPPVPVPNFVQPKLENSVEELLRKQREQFEANLELNQTSELDQSLDKSFLKLLPKSQQQEYKLLKQKLLQASKSTSESKSNKPIRAKTAISTAAIKEARTSLRDAAKKERLQQKGKYKELAPLVRKINMEVEAKRKCQEHVKKLMEELQSAQMQLNAHQQRHSSLVGQFKRARGLLEQRFVLSTPNFANSCLSVYYRSARSAQMKQLQQQQESNVKFPSKPSLVMRNNSLKNGIAKNAAVVQISTSAIITKAEFKDIQQSDDKTSISMMQHSTPFTIDEEITAPAYTTTTGDKLAPTLPDPFAYVSPLDKRGSCNPTNNNPLQMLCPYELFGVCKDKSCTFNHCP